MVQSNIKQNKKKETHDIIDEDRYGQRDEIHMNMPMTWNLDNY